MPQPAHKGSLTAYVNIQFHQYIKESVCLSLTMDTSFFVRKFISVYNIRGPPSGLN